MLTHKDSLLMVACLFRTQPNESSSRRAQKPVATHRATLRRRQETPPADPAHPPEYLTPEYIEALHDASKTYRMEYGGPKKRRLREDLRLGVSGYSDAERQRFAQLERDHLAYRRYKEQGKVPPPPAPAPAPPPPLSAPAPAQHISPPAMGSNPSAIADLSLTSIAISPEALAQRVAELEAEVARLRRAANTYRREFLGRHNAAKKARFEAAAAATADAADAANSAAAEQSAAITPSSAAAAEVPEAITAAQLERYRRLRDAYARSQNAYTKLQRATGRQLQAAHDLYEREYVHAPDAAARRARFEAAATSEVGAADAPTAEERQAYESLRRAHEDYKVKLGGGSSSRVAAGADASEQPKDGPRRKRRGGRGGPPASAAATGPRDIAQGDMSDAGWAALHEQAKAYRQTFLKNPALKEEVERGGGTPEQREAFRTGRAAFNTYMVRSQRRQVRASRRRVEYPAAVAPEVAQLEALRSDYLRHRRLRDPARRAAFLADDAALGGAKRAELDRLNEVAREYTRVYAAARQKAREAEKDAQAGRGSRQPLAWARFLTPEQQRRLSEISADNKRFRALGLDVRAKRDAYLEVDPDGSKRAEYNALHRSYTEYRRLYREAKRVQEGRVDREDDDDRFEEDNDEEGTGPSPVAAPQTIVEWTLTGRRRYFGRNFRSPRQPLGQKPDAGTTEGGEGGGGGSSSQLQSGGDSGGPQLFGVVKSGTTSGLVPSEMWRRVRSGVASIGAQARTAGAELLRSARAQKANRPPRGLLGSWAPAAPLPLGLTVAH